MSTETSQQTGGRVGLAGRTAEKWHLERRKRVENDGTTELVFVYIDHTKDVDRRHEMEALRK